MFLVSNLFPWHRSLFDYKDSIFADIATLQSSKNIRQFITCVLNNINAPPPFVDTMCTSYPSPPHCGGISLLLSPRQCTTNCHKRRPTKSVIKINIEKKIRFFCKKICQFKKSAYLCNRNQQANDSVAQLVEQMTLNHWVESSSLSGVTKR